MAHITSAIYGKHPVTGENSCVNAIIDGIAWSIPIEGSYDDNSHWFGNMHYKEIVDWIEEGNTIEEAE